MAIINGNESANTLTGGSAADTLNGLGGNDTLLGNGDNDTLDGGTGNDLLIGGRGSDTYRFGQGYGFDVIDNSGGANSDVDTIRLTNLNANQIRLTRIGSDLVLSVLTTGETLTVSQHFLDADHAIDRIQFADGSRWSASDILANLFYPPVVPTNGADVINGNPGDDILLGLGGNDTLLGNGGNDTLDGGSGNDRMEGGVGDDTYMVDAAADVVVEANNAGDDLVQASINYNLGSNVERLTLTGSANINGTGNGLDNTLNGNTGNNILDGGSGNDLIQGGDGDDTLQGGAGNDNLSGDAGNDLLDGGSGNDSMAGGSGNDIYIVAQAADVVSEQPGDGTDTVRSSVNYSLGANLENLELTGSSNLNGTGNTLANRLTGNTGNNRLDGGAGDDVLAGRRGNDTYLYGSNYGNDVIDNSGGAAADIDTVQLVGLNSGNVRFVHIGNDLQMVVLATSQTLTVKNFYLGADYEIDRVRFDNNVVWNTATLKAAATSPVNVAPTSTDDSQVTLEDTPVILGSADFGTYSDPENSPLAAVKITGLPTLGSLQYNNGSAWIAVVQDQVISKADLDAGKLQFVPAPDGNGSGYVSIGFKVSDGTAFSINANTLSVNVTPVNDAPTVSGPVSLPGGTEDTVYTITAAQLLANASDVDVGESLSVQSISVDPADGSITATPNGSWTFTPALDRNGLVNFALVIADSAGATVATSAILSLAAVDDAPAAVATVTALSDDSGIAGDFITNIETQTLSGTYTGTLNSGEIIQVSADGGTTWVNAVADNATHNWSASGVTLISSGTGLLVQTINAAGNSRAGTGHSYTFDTSADVGNDLRVVLADRLINNVEKTAVAYSVTGLDADASAVVTFSDSTNNHVFGVNGSADLSSLNDGPINVSIVATDGAGNSASGLTSTGSSLSFDEFLSDSELTTQYQSLGVTVSGGVTILNEFNSPWPAQSGVNLVYAGSGLMIFTFDSAITGNIQTVSAYVSGAANTGLFAYDAAGVLVGQALLPPGAPANTRLTVNSSGGPVARLEIHDGGATFGVDSLTFSTAGSLTLDTIADTGGDLTVSLADTLITNTEKSAVAYTVTGLDVDASAIVSFSDGSQSVVGVNGSADLSSLGDGPISVSVTASDTAGNTASGTGSTFTLDTTAPLVSGPVTLADGSEDSAYIFSAEQLLANTSDIGNTPSVKSVSVNPNDGTLTDHGDGSWTFTPVANRNGAVAFNVVVTDGGNDVATSANLNLAAVNDAPAGDVIISGNATETQTLTASNTLADVDGLGTVSYQWQLSADGSSNWTDIAGTTSNTLVLSNALLGQHVRVVASYTDGGGTVESEASAATAAVAQLVNQFEGDADNNVLDGTAYSDILRGFGGADILNGQAEADTLDGGDGDDTLSGGEGDDTLNGGNGNDTLLGDNGADTLDGGNGNDTLRGGVGNDVLTGGMDGSFDQLNGDDGDDQLMLARGYASGGNGNDILDVRTALVGAAVNLSGDAGSDIYR
ncbi:beta strand repeat-containing protein, partial [Pseudomonas azerbaijanorientalis]